MTDPQIIKDAQEVVEAAVRAAIDRMPVKPDFNAVAHACKAAVEAMRELPAIPVTEYDPATCITAGELREMGFPVPDEIPDCGWVPRTEMVMNAEPESTPEDINAQILRMDMRLDFKVPFKWIEFKSVITKEGVGFEP